jgi:TolB-like protein
VEAFNCDCGSCPQPKRGSLADGHMRFLFLVATGLPLLAFVTSAAPGPLPIVAPDVAVAPFSVERDSAGVLRALADSCLERLVRGLTAEGIAVARHPQLSEKNLDAARPAQWAVLGHLGREAGQFRVELRLLEVKSGEELRSYFNADNESEPIVKFGEAAAVRIGSVIQEQKGPHRAP